MRSQFHVAAYLSFIIRDPTLSSDIEKAKEQSVAARRRQGRLTGFVKSRGID